MPSGVVESHSRPPTWLLPVLLLAALLSLVGAMGRPFHADEAGQWSLAADAVHCRPLWARLILEMRSSRQVDKFGRLSYRMVGVRRHCGTTLLPPDDYSILSYCMRLNATQAT